MLAVIIHPVACLNFSTVNGDDVALVHGIWLLGLGLLLLADSTTTILWRGEEGLLFAIAVAAQAQERYLSTGFWLLL